MVDTMYFGFFTATKDFEIFKTRGGLDLALGVLFCFDSIAERNAWVAAGPDAVTENKCGSKGTVTRWAHNGRGRLVGLCADNPNPRRSVDSYLLPSGWEAGDAKKWFEKTDFKFSEIG